MVMAPRADQLQLLRVAELDADIARLKRADAQHPLRVDVGELVNLIAANARSIADNDVALAQAQSELDSLEATSSEVREVIKAKEELYRAGTGMDSRGLLTLQSEIDQARQRLDVVSDEEFQALEKVEDLHATRERLNDEKDELNRKMLDRRVELENAVTEIQGEIAQVAAQREALYISLDAVLKHEYERAAASGGYAVIGLYPNGTSTGGVQLSPIEVNQIKKADPDSVWISEDYDCIVVLLDA